MINLVMKLKAEVEVRRPRRLVGDLRRVISRALQGEDASAKRINPYCISVFAERTLLDWSTDDIALFVYVSGRPYDNVRQSEIWRVVNNCLRDHFPGSRTIVQVQITREVL